MEIPSLPQRGLSFEVTGHHQDRNVKLRRDLRDLIARHLRHVNARDYEAQWHVPNDVRGLTPGPGANDLHVRDILKRLADQVPQVRMGIDDQNRSHSASRMRYCSNWYTRPWRSVQRFRRICVNSV